MTLANPGSAGTSQYKEAERIERIEYYRDWFTHMYQMLGLDHWTISVKYAPAGPGAAAEVWRQPGQLAGRIRLSDEFYEDSREDQRQTLLHELLHLHLRPYWEACLTVEDVLGLAAWQVFGKMFETAEEWVADGLARAIAPLFPLPPPWPPEEHEPLPGLELEHTTIFTDGDTSTRKMVLPHASLLALAAALRGLNAKDLPGPEAPPDWVPPEEALAVSAPYAPEPEPLTAVDDADPFPNRRKKRTIGPPVDDGPGPAVE